ncbi:MAG: hypothetical protein RLZ64_1671, partial [Pseudomonadota bacterium]
MKPIRRIQTALRASALTLSSSLVIFGY